MLSVATLDDFTQGNACGTGIDFRCSLRGGLFSCRPCDFPQLGQFKALQEQANNLVHAFNLDKRAAVAVKPRSCRGGFLLAIDGRIGPCTTRTIAEIVLNKGPKELAPPAPLSRANFKKTPEYVATFAPEIEDYLTALAGLKNAPKDVPAPPKQPIDDSAGGAPGKVPPDVVVSPTPDGGVVIAPTKRKTSTGLVVGAIAGLAAIGLVAAGVYHRRQAA